MGLVKFEPSDDGTATKKAPRWSRKIWDLSTSMASPKTIALTVLFSSVVVIQIVVAIVAFFLLYNSILPNMKTHIPLDLQYGYGDNPFALASLDAYSIKAEQTYDVSVALAIPPHRPNIDKGNFMLTAHLLVTADKFLSFSSTELAGSPAKADKPSKEKLLKNASVLATYRRSILLPYTDPMVSLAYRIIFLPFYIFRRGGKEKITLNTKLADGILLSNKAGDVASYILVEIEAGQDMRVAESTATLTARLRGIRWFLYHHRIISFTVITTSFWLVEVISTLAFCGVAMYLIKGSPRSEGIFGSGNYDNRLEMPTRKLIHPQPNRVTMKALKYKDNNETESDSVKMEKSRSESPDVSSAAVKHEDPNLLIDAVNIKKEDGDGGEELAPATDDTEKYNKSDNIGGSSSAKLDLELPTIAPVPDVAVKQEGHDLLDDEAVIKRESDNGIGNLARATGRADNTGDKTVASNIVQRRPHDNMAKNV